MFLLCCLGLAAQAQGGLAPGAGDARPLSPSYKISLEVDYRAAMLAGREVVGVVNSTRHDLESVNFFLYPNVGQSDEEEPYLQVRRVSSDGHELSVSARARMTLIQVALPAKLAPGELVELTLEFAARVPRLQREETTLLAHFLQEANDAVSAERQRRDARDIFFAADQSMLLGYFSPMLVPHDAVVTEQGMAFGAGGIVFSEVGDYEVSVTADAQLTVIGSAPVVSTQVLKGEDGERSRAMRVLRGERLRGFALALCEQVQPTEAAFGAVRVTTWLKVGDENLSRRLLNVTTRALDVYSHAFGAYLYPTLNVIALPLPAGYSGIEFPGLVVLAEAYCIDFESPQASRLPGLVREQADVIQSALEFTLAHCLAHQWWGNAVGSDPQRNAYLDEALANFAAAYYFEAAAGEAAGTEAVNKHLRATYQVYRSLGGADGEVDKPAREFRSAIQYAALVQAKSAMMMIALRRQLGDEAFFKALRTYYAQFRLKLATPRDLRAALVSVSNDPNATRALLHRYLKERHGDRDIGSPDVTIFSSQKSKARKLGHFFGRIGRAAARPF